MTTAEAAIHDSVHPPVWRRTSYRAADWFPAEQLAEARRYARPLHRLQFVSSVVDFLVFAAIIAFEVPHKVIDWAGDPPWPLQIPLIFVVGLLISMPFDLTVKAYVQLVYDKRWGLSTQTPGRMIADFAKSAVESIVITSLMLIPVYWAIRTFELWWLWAWLIVVSLQIVMAFLYPIVIMPRFNKFVPLGEGELRTRIEAVSDLAGCPVEGIYTMDASKRTTRTNAAVVGFGATKRIVLYDTILESPIEHIEQIVAHEIGHYRLKHIPKTIPFVAVTLLVALLIVGVLAGWDPLLDFAGVEELGDPRSLPLFLLAFALAMEVLNVFQAWFTRGKEREADLEALELLGRPDIFIDTWRALAPKDKVELEPSWWTKLKHSHPEVPERMAFGQAWKDSNPPAS